MNLSLKLLLAFGITFTSMGVYTIRELENLSGIKAHTIRIWEKRYGLITPQRTSTNIRTYRDTELKKLLNISTLNRNGLKISKIARLSAEEMITKINQYTQDLTSTESQIENLTVAMIDLDEYRFEQILARSVIKYGFEETVIRILYPFFVRIGLMWQMDSINTTQEHFVSNLVRQKFFSAIDNLEFNPRSAKCRLVFFLPDGEFHEISLLFYCYLAKKRGFHTVYLGQSLPLNDLADLSGNYPFDFLVTSINTSYSKKDTEEFIRTIAQKIPDREVIVSGSKILDFRGDLPQNIIPVALPQDFIKKLDTFDL